MSSKKNSFFISVMLSLDYSCRQFSFFQTIGKLVSFLIIKSFLK